MENAIPQTPTTPQRRAARAVDDALRARVIATARVALPRRVDPTYDREIANYKQWVEQQGLPLQNGKYLTNIYVDLYFSEVQQTRLVTANTGRRVVSALQHYADTVEYAGAAERFDVDSPTVKAMLVCQKQNKTRHELQITKDYHVKLPVKNLTYNEKSQIVRYVLQSNKPYWSDFLTTWNACNAMFCRVDTMRKIKLSDIFIDFGHSVAGVKQDPTYEFDNRMIGLILRPHIHKERAEKTRVIGAYRHKDPYMCFTGSLAMNLFVFFHEQQDINFHDENYNIMNGITSETMRCRDTNYIEPKWSKIELIRTWRNHGAANASYTQVLDANNLKWEKVTHMRKSGIESASAAGLDAQSIGTMSKHQSERGSSKMNTVYVTELFPPVLLWAAGYDKNDINSYNNPRTRLQLPIIDNDDVLHAIFPKLEQWKAEQRDENGDNRECAEHFVNVVLPFLAMVVIQDGIYWIHDYPQSLPSRLLQERMRAVFPGYIRWAHEARQEIIRQAQSVGQVQVETLNATAQRAFNMMVSKMEVLQEKQSHQQRQQQQEQSIQRQWQQQQQQHQVHHQQQQLQILQLLELQHQQNQQYQQQVQQQQQHILHQQLKIQRLLAQIQGNNDNDNGIIDIDNNDGNGNDNDNNNGNSNIVNDQNVVVDMDNHNYYNENNDVRPPITNNVPIIPMYAPPPPRPIYNIEPIIIAAAATNVNDALQNVPTVPPIPTQLPRSLQELVVQHYDNRLEQYNNSCKAHWPSNIQQAFSKRKYLFNYIQVRAARMRGTDTIKNKMVITAIRIDQTERENVSVDKFLTMVRNSDPQRKKRNRLPRPRQQQLN